jgi:alpha-1,2-mannosyltransferase
MEWAVGLSTALTRGLAGKVIGVLIILLALSALAAVLMSAPLELYHGWGWDVAVFRGAAKAFLNGVNPYVPENVERFSDGAQLSTIPTFSYAPFATILFIPLALLPPEYAIRMWFMINLLLYVASAALFLRAMNWGYKRSSALLLGFGLALFSPVRTLLVLGQSAMLMLFFLTVSFYMLRKGRPTGAGLVFALALFKPQLALVPLFMLLRRRGRFLLGLGVGLALLLLPFWGWMDDWYRALISTYNENVENTCISFASFNMLLRCLLPTEGSQRVILGSMALLVLTTLWYLRKPFQPRRVDLSLSIGLLVAVSMFAIDYIYTADLVLLLFPFLALFEALGQIRNRWTRNFVIVGMASAFIFPDFVRLRAVLSGASRLLGLPIFYAIMSALLAFSIALCLMALQRQSGAEPEKGQLQSDLNGAGGSKS